VCRGIAGSGEGGGELCDRPRQLSLRGGKMGHKMNILNEKIENLH